MSGNLVEPFWQGVDAGDLRLPHCDACNYVQWYPEPRCTKCHGRTFTWRSHERRGTVFTRTVVRRQFAAEGPNPPATILLVQLDDAPHVRLIMNPVAGEDEGFAIGAPVDIEFVARADRTVLGARNASLADRDGRMIEACR